MSFFGTGFSPLAPGTCASIITIIILYLLKRTQLSIIILSVFCISLTIVSCHLAHSIELKYKIKDPSWIVMDEVIGMLMAWLIAGRNDIINLSILLILFRIMDIFKPWPASYADKKIKHGIGIILDDVIAGSYAAFATLIIINWHFCWSNVLRIFYA